MTPRRHPLEHFVGASPGALVVGLVLAVVGVTSLAVGYVFSGETFPMDGWQFYAWVFGWTAFIAGATVLRGSSARTFRLKRLYAVFVISGFVFALSLVVGHVLARWGRELGLAGPTRGFLDIAYLVGVVLGALVWVVADQQITKRAVSLALEGRAGPGEMF